MSSTRAIVLSREDFGEADCYVQFFTRDWGLISVLAKSAKKSRRRFVGGLDLFCHDEIFIKGDPKERALLLELTVLNSFTGIRESIERTMAAGKLLQWVKKLGATGAPMPGLYSLLGQMLALIEKENDDQRLELLTLIFKLKLLSQLGLKPHVESCARCSSILEEEVFFDLEVGGILCRRCSPPSLSPTLFLAIEERNFLQIADQFRLASWNDIRFPVDKTSHLTRLVAQFVAYHTNLRLPM